MLCLAAATTVCHADLGDLCAATRMARPCWRKSARIRGSAMISGGARRLRSKSATRRALQPDPGPSARTLVSPRRLRDGSRPARATPDSTRQQQASPVGDLRPPVTCHPHRAEDGSVTASRSGTSIWKKVSGHDHYR